MKIYHILQENIAFPLEVAALKEKILLTPMATQNPEKVYKE